MSFDSILVRLKDKKVAMNEVILNGFDSILVRLKGIDSVAYYKLEEVLIPYWFD